MRKLEVAPPTESDVVELVRTIREADRSEILRMGHLSPEAALRQGVELSDSCWCARYEGVVLAVWGVRIIEPLLGVGYPWALTSDAIEKHPILFARHSRRWLRWLCRTTPRLTVLVDSEHREACRWLRWLGFQFDGPYPWGPGNHPFLRASVGL